jgi:hypothetical protein
MSGLGGTTGRAAGCPAKWGFASGRSGPLGLGCEGACGVPGPGAKVALGGRMGRGGAGAPGDAETGDGAAGGALLAAGAGRGAPGVLTGELTGELTGAPRGLADSGGGVEGTGGRSAGGAGNGWRGPERICPGRACGGGEGRAGIGMPRGATGGTSGDPVESGGRSGGMIGRATGGEDSSAAASFASFFSGCLSCVSGTSRASGGALGAGGAAARGAGAADSSSSSGGVGRGAGGGAPSPVTRCRMAKTRSSSSELEWVFLSWMPRSGSRSIITVGLTSSSRASSLIRILLITEIVCERTKPQTDFCYSPFSAAPVSVLGEES